jgi:hypothetical protein
VDLVFLLDPTAVAIAAFWWAPVVEVTLRPVVAVCKEARGPIEDCLGPVPTAEACGDLRTAAIFVLSVEGTLAPLSEESALTERLPVSHEWSETEKFFQSYPQYSMWNEDLQ